MSGAALPRPLAVDAATPIACDKPCDGNGLDGTITPVFSGVATCSPSLSSREGFAGSSIRQCYRYVQPLTWGPYWGADRYAPRAVPSGPVAGVETVAPQPTPYQG